MTAPLLLTFRDAGELIGVSGKTIQRLVANGELRAVDITAVKGNGGARRLRIREDDLRKWIEKRTAETKTA